MTSDEDDFFPNSLWVGPDDDDTGDDDLDLWHEDPQAELILRLFRGMTNSSNNPRDRSCLRRRRLTAAEEAASRKAFASLLRKVPKPPYDGELLQKWERQNAIFRQACHELADLLDPPDRKGEWKIKFIKSKGRLSQPLVEMSIYWRVGRAVDRGLSVEEAVAEVAEEYGCSESWALRQWSRGLASGLKWPHYTK